MEKIVELKDKGILQPILYIYKHKIPSLIGEWLLDHSEDHQDYDNIFSSLEYGDMPAMINYVKSWTICGLPVEIIDE